jgi:hypothetical protein
MLAGLTGKHIAKGRLGSGPALGPNTRPEYQPDQSIQDSRYIEETQP